MRHFCLTLPLACLLALLPACGSSDDDSPAPSTSTAGAPGASGASTSTSGSAGASSGHGGVTGAGGHSGTSVGGKAGDGGASGAAGKGGSGAGAGGITNGGAGGAPHGGSAGTSGVAGASSGGASIGGMSNGGQSAAGASSAGAAGSAGAIPSDPTGLAASRASALLDGIGVNTHIDFPGYQTIGLAGIEKAIDYVGDSHLRLLRDSPADDQDLQDWSAVATATGVRFDAFLAEGAPSVYADGLARMKKMAAAGTYLFALEGGNEEDDTYPVSLGNNQMMAAAFQPNVWSAGQTLGMPVFQISFGAGWSMPTGDYGTVGNLSAYADFGNAHTYPQVAPYHDVHALETDALLTTPGKPVAHSEWGWNTWAGTPTSGYGWCSEVSCAAYDVDFILDAFVSGSPYYFRYELFDDDALEKANSWGLFYDDGTPKQSATAMRVLFQLLEDDAPAASTFSPGKLDVSIDGMPAFDGQHGGQKALFQKSDGSFWLALWNEQNLNNPAANNADVAVPKVPITLKLTTEATHVAVYDVLAQSTTPVTTADGVTSVALELPAHPVLVRIDRP